MGCVWVTLVVVGVAIVLLLLERRNNREQWVLSSKVVTGIEAPGSNWLLIEVDDDGKKSSGAKGPKDR